MPEDDHMDEGHQPYISFTVKELLADIRTQLGNITTLLAGKADREDVSRLDGRMDRVESDVATLKHHHESDVAQSLWRENWRRWLVEAILAAAAVLAIIFTRSLG